MWRSAERATRGNHPRYQVTRQSSSPPAQSRKALILDKRSLRRGRAQAESSFQILNLLPNLLQLGLHFHHASADGGVGSFGTDRVGLSVHLLEQKVELSPYHTPLIEELEKLLAVTPQADDFLGYVGSIREERDLHCNPFLRH